MTQLTITIDTETEDATEREILRLLLGEGEQEEVLADVIDPAAIVTDLMDSVSLSTRQFIMGFVDVADNPDNSGPITLEKVAEQLDVPYQNVKTRKWSLGRSFNRLSRKYPNMPELLQQRWNLDLQQNEYVMPDGFITAFIDYYNANLGKFE